jgi:glycosyltransferase involved in cell wall biosynthesis
MGEARVRDVDQRPPDRLGGADLLRIAHFALGRTNPEAADGIDKTVYHLTRTQAMLGHTVRLFSITNKAPIPIPGVEVSTYRSMEPPAILPTARLRNLLVWRSPFNLPKRVFSDLSGWQPDILHLHGVHIPQHLRLARHARRSGIPYCFTVHGMLASDANARHRWLKRAAATFERPVLARAAFLHALTENECEDLQSYGTTAPIVIASNGIDLGPFLVRRERSAAATLECMEFVFLGRLDPFQKGLDLLLEGFARSQLQHAVLSLVGPDWRSAKAKLEATARRLGVAGRVRFLGRASGSAKIEHLVGASLFVHPSRWEGVAFSVLEAAAVGSPLLLTAAADPRGSFGRAGAAIIVLPSAADIARGLQQFARMTPAERLEMGHRSRRVVELDFTWSSTAATLLQAYQQHRRAVS